MDHEPRAARQIAVFRREKAHERRARGVYGGLAQENEPTFRTQFRMETNILTHHPRKFRVAAQRGNFHHDQPVLRRGGQPFLEMDIHAMIDIARQPDRGVGEILWRQHRRLHRHRPSCPLVMGNRAALRATRQMVPWPNAFSWREAQDAVKNRP